MLADEKVGIAFFETSNVGHTVGLCLLSCHLDYALWLIAFLPRMLYTHIISFWDIPACCLTWIGTFRLGSRRRSFY